MKNSGWRRAIVLNIFRRIVVYTRSGLIMSAESPISVNCLDPAQFSFTHPTYTVLEKAASRTLCPNCNCLRKYYCYDCVIPIEHVPPTPAYDLPFEFHIIRHASEKRSKSSIIPLKLLYPNKVFLYTFKQANRFEKDSVCSVSPAFPDWNDADHTVLLFPEEGKSKTVKEMNSAELWAAMVIKNVPQISRVDKKIRLVDGHKTIFWRHQSIDRSCLATCEAIYALLREVWDSVSEKPYDGRYDDVMFYYMFIHKLINEHYSSTKRHKGHLPDYALDP